MTLRQLEYFMVSAKYENITKAARELHISQPSLSECITKLEQEIGVPLFNRIGRNIVLNNDGKDFLKSSHSIFEIINRNKQRTLYLSSFGQEIVLGFRCTETHLSELLSQYIKYHPEVTFRLLSVYNTVRQKGNDSLDFYISRGLDGHNGRFCIALTEEEHGVLLKENLLKKDTNTVDLNDLKDQCFIFCSPNAKLPMGYSKCIDAGFVPKISAIVDDRFVLWSLLKKGNFVTVLPFTDAYNFHGQNGYICRHIKDEQPPANKIYISWKDESKLTKAAAAFLEYLLDQYSLNKSDAQYMNEL